MPNRALAAGADATSPRWAQLAPFAADKTALGGRPTAYVCERGRCELPLRDAEALATLLAHARPY